MKKYRIIIAGGRYFSDFKLLNESVTKIAGHLSPDETEFVSGTASGADKLGERWAIGRGYGLKRFPADWNKHGKGAGPIRNKQMAEYGTHLIAFWDGVSRGTENMINEAKAMGLIVRVVRY